MYVINSRKPALKKCSPHLKGIETEFLQKSSSLQNFPVYLTMVLLTVRVGMKNIYVVIFKSVIIKNTITKKNERELKQINQKGYSFGLPGSLILYYPELLIAFSFILFKIWIKEYTSWVDAQSIN